MIFNLVQGKAKVATITVTAPAGTTVKCTQSPYSLSGTVASTSVSFTVPKAGTWSISATKGGTTKTSSVSVAAYGGSYSASFTFESWLFKEGSGAQVSLYDKGRVTFSDASFVCGSGPETYTINKVDLTNYSKICIEYVSKYGNSFSIGITQNADYRAIPIYWTASKALSKVTSRSTTTLDISAYTGSYYICLEGSVMGDSNSLTGYNWYLSA